MIQSIVHIALVVKDYDEARNKIGLSETRRVVEFFCF